MSHLNHSSQTPLSNLDSAGFATFTSGNIYRSSAEEFRRTEARDQQRSLNHNSQGDYAANLVIRPKLLQKASQDENAHLTRADVKWRESQVRVVDGQHVLNSKAVKRRQMSQRPVKVQAQSFYKKSAVKQQLESQVAESQDNLTHFSSYKGSKLRVVQSNVVAKPKVLSEASPSQLHQSQDPNFSDQLTNLQTNVVGASYTDKKPTKDNFSKLQSNGRYRFKQTLQQSADSKQMPKVNPMAILYHTAASEMTKSTTKSEKAINRQFRKLWKKNTFRSVTQQMVLDNEIDIQRKAASVKKEQPATNTQWLNDTSQRSLMHDQISETYGLITGTEQMRLPLSTPAKVYTQESQRSPHRKTPKTLTKFAKRDELFQKQYTQQLKQWDTLYHDKQETKKEQKFQSDKKFDTNLYKEREDDFPIVANRLLQLGQVQERKYFNKTNTAMLQDSFDPIRIRLRVIPISRAPVGKGKNADFYFVEAGKKSMRGELPQAFDLLRRGLQLSPSHFLCRFSHGVLQFKFGLIVEASADFKMLTITNPKEPLPYFNLAICLSQMGVPSHEQNMHRGLTQNKLTTETQARLEELEISEMTSVKKFEYILQLCQQVIDLSKGNNQDKCLIIDAYYLQAVGYYRLHRPLESVAAFNAGKRIKKRMEEAQIHETNPQNYEQMYADVWLQEIDSEVQKVQQKVQKRRSSFDFTPNEQISKLDERRLSQVHIDEQKPENVQKQSLNAQQRFIPYSILKQNFKKKMQQDQNITRNITFQQEASIQKPKIQLFNMPAPLAPDESKPSVSPLKNLLASLSPKNLLEKLKSSIVERMNIKTYLKNLKKELFPKVVAGMDAGVFDREFRFFQQSYASLIRQQDKIVDGDDVLRFRTLYLQKHDVEKGIFVDCNQHEIKELERRKELEDWILDSEFLKQQLIEYLKKMDQQQDMRLVDMILKIAPIKERIVSGTDIDALRYVLVDQNLLVDNMYALQSKQQRKSEVIDAELQHEEKVLFSLTITDEELKILNGSDKPQNMEEYKFGKKDILIERLQESLQKQNMTSDDVCNLLSNDLYEREKKASQLKSASEHQSGKRFTCKHLQVIQIELVKYSFERNLQLLDKLLSHLRYFKRLDQQTRIELYQNGDYVKYDAQQTIFRQGDEGDFMYIILKGKVSLSVNMPNRPQIQSVMSMLNDGDCFGEVTLFDFNKIQEGSNKTNSSNQPSQTRKRGNTCVAVEESFLLKISHQHAKEILQPDAARLRHREERSQTTMLNSPHSSAPKAGMTFDSDLSSTLRTQTQISPKVDDEVTSKIKFLMSFDFFKEISYKSLLPMAVNMQKVSFAYGDYIQQEGQVPKGLYLIKSGQCVVGKFELARREHDPANLPGGRKLQKDTKNPLFNEYDMENTLLNNVKQQNKTYQNNRIFVTEKGEQIKGEIHYENLVTYQKLVPGNWFGGRVLLPFELYMSQRKIYFGQNYVQRPRSSSQKNESEEVYQLKSFLNVIADSGVVETFLLTKAEMQYLRDSELKTVYEQIVQVKEPDRPNTEAAVQEKYREMQNWEKFKIKTTKQVVQRNLIEKYGPDALAHRK